MRVGILVRGGLGGVWGVSEILQIGRRRLGGDGRLRSDGNVWKRNGGLDTGRENETEGDKERERTKLCIQIWS